MTSKNEEKNTPKYLRFLWFSGFVKTEKGRTSKWRNDFLIRSGVRKKSKSCVKKTRYLFYSELCHFYNHQNFCVKSWWANARKFQFCAKVNKTILFTQHVKETGNSVRNFFFSFLTQITKRWLNLKSYFHFWTYPQKNIQDIIVIWQKKLWIGAKWKYIFWN